MDHTSQGKKMIQSPLAHVEEHQPPQSTSIPPTRVVQVTWIHPLPSTLCDGEWSVFWDGIDSALGIDEGYGSLEGASEEASKKDETPASEPAIPVDLDALEDSYFEKIFQDRAIVQTPTRIVPPLNSVSPTSPSSKQKFSVFFLLSQSCAVPEFVKIRFTPIWSSPISPSPTVTIPVKPASDSFKRGDLHKAWAKSRLVDLHELQELADELARTGQRGVGTGILKVGVDGGGHGEERVRWEAEMVGRERNWVLKTFLGKVLTGLTLEGDKVHQKAADKDEEYTEQKEIEEGLEMLGKLAEGLKFNDEANAPNMPAADPDDSPTLPSANPALFPSNDNEDDDLFALPLSPRSPDMGVSPFSFRELAIGNLDATILGTTPTARQLNVLSPASKDAIPVEGGASLTPTLKGTPNPGEMRKKRLAGPGISG